MFDAVELQTPYGSVPDGFEVVIGFSTRHATFGAVDLVVDEDAFKQALKEIPQLKVNYSQYFMGKIKSLLANEKYQNGALWIQVTPYVLDYLSIHELYQAGFKLHHVGDKKTVFYFYKYNNPNIVDPVPPYATSVQGGKFCLVANKNGKSYFLLTEEKRYPKSPGDLVKFVYNIPGGGANIGEYQYDTAVRELKEELDIVLPPVENVRLAPGGSYITSEGMFGDEFTTATADSFNVFIVNVDMDQLTLGKIDHNEVISVKWMPVDLLSQYYEEKVYASTRAEIDSNSYTDCEFEDLKSGAILTKYPPRFDVYNSVSSIAYNIQKFEAKKRELGEAIDSEDISMMRAALKRLHDDSVFGIACKMKTNGAKITY